MSHVKKAFLSSKIQRNLQTYLLQLRLTLSPKFLSNSSHTFLIIQGLSQFIQVNQTSLELGLFFLLWFRSGLVIFLLRLLVLYVLSFYILVGLFAFETNFRK